MHGNRHAVLEREPPVSGDVIGVRVCLEDSDDADSRLVCSLDVLLGGVRGVDQEGLPLAGVADQVGSAAKIVVDELAEQLEREANTAPRYFS
jgi:hypothetical protein